MMRKEKNEPKVLDVNASMHGNLTFKDPVNLRINGDFEGKLDTKGSLTIGDNASVRADVTGEEIFVSGKVTGNIIAQKKLSLLSKAHIVGDITTPVLGIEAGAILHGKCQMLNYPGQKGRIFNTDELAKYLEVDVNDIINWANSGKIPTFKEGDQWKFDRVLIDEWIAKERKV